MSVFSGFLEYLLISIFIAPFSFKVAKMDRSGALAAFLIGLVVYISLGFKGFLILLSLHVIGAFVTRYGYMEKAGNQIAQRKRVFGNVLANGFFPGLAAFLSGFSGSASMYYVVYVSTVAAATADTVSSEIGELSNKRPRVITTFEKVNTGTDGAVSTLGTVASLAAALIIAVLADFLNVMDVPGLYILVIVVLSGFFGTTVDSVLGATLERRRVIGNNTVNFLSVGASFLFSLFCYSILV